MNICAKQRNMAMRSLFECANEQRSDARIAKIAQGSKIQESVKMRFCACESVIDKSVWRRVLIQESLLEPVLKQVMIGSRRFSHRNKLTAGTICQLVPERYCPMVEENECTRERTDGTQQWCTSDSEFNGSRNEHNMIGVGDIMISLNVDSVSKIRASAHRCVL